jgi:ABC-type nickel/cobalt efflux system permease component RcnA
VKKWLLLSAAIAALAACASAAAHPLGNFTINRYSRVEPSGGRVYVLYVLDMAEIPTFQARDRLAALGRQRYAAALAHEISRGLQLRAGGRAQPLVELKRELAFPPGQAGLRTTRLEVLYRTPALRSSLPTSLAYVDRNYPGRIGWKEIVMRPADGAQVTGSTAPTSSISRELLAYPKNLLQSPLDVTRAHATLVPGSGDGTAPTLIPARLLESRVGVRNVADGGFASLVNRSDLSLLVILASLGVALFWGAVHALSPGHGKTIVTAYLVGQRGKPRHAIYLGLITTVTHTIGVFSLGAVTLLLSQFVVPDRLYPWLNLVSGLFVVVIGGSVLWARARRRPTHQHHGHDHGHDHAHGHHHHGHHHHGHEHGHSHEPGQAGTAAGPSRRSLIAVGVSGGLLPCPSALVVLLAAISLHRISFGLALISAFSLGLAATISGIGLLAVCAKRVFARIGFDGRLTGLLPAASALVILVAGVLMTLRALPKVG